MSTNAFFVTGVRLLSVDVRFPSLITFIRHLPPIPSFLSVREPNTPDDVMRLKSILQRDDIKSSIALLGIETFG